MMLSWYWAGQLKLSVSHMIKRVNNQYIYIHSVCIQLFCFFIFSRVFNNLGFPGGSDGKESACNVGDLGSIPGMGRFPGGGTDSLLQYSCMENPTDRGVW